MIKLSYAVTLLLMLSSLTVPNAWNISPQSSTNMTSITPGQPGFTLTATTSHTKTGVAVNPRSGSLGVRNLPKGAGRSSVTKRKPTSPGTYSFHIMAESVSGCTAINPTTTFLHTDSEAWVFFEATISASFEVQFYSRDTTSRNWDLYSDSGQQAGSGTYCVGWSIYVNGYWPASNYPRAWLIEVYLDGSPAFLEFFEVTDYNLSNGNVFETATGVDTNGNPINPGQSVFTVGVQSAAYAYLRLNDIAYCSESGFTACMDTNGHVHSWYAYWLLNGAIVGGYSNSFPDYKNSNLNSNYWSYGYDPYDYISLDSSKVGNWEVDLYLDQYFSGGGPVWYGPVAKVFFTVQAAPSTTTSTSTSTTTSTTGTTTTTTTSSTISETQTAFVTTPTSTTTTSTTVSTSATTPFATTTTVLTVTVPTPTTTTTSSATVTSSTSETSSTSTTSTSSTIAGSATNTIYQSPLITNTLTTTTFTSGTMASTSTTTFTSPLATSYSTSTSTSFSQTITQTGVTTVSTISSETTTSTDTAFSTTTSAGTVTISQTDTFNVLLTTIFQELHQLEDLILQFLGFHVTATPVGQQVNEVIVTTTAPVTMTISYQAPGGGNPTAPAFHYVLNGKSKAVTLTTAATKVKVDSGSSWYVTPNPLTGSTSIERWDSNQALSGAASSTTLVFMFYHQTLQTLSYYVKGGGTPNAPTFQSKRFGSLASVMLGATPTGTWFDVGAAWVVTNPLSGSTSSERWFTSQLASGTIGLASTMAFTYQHQYYLTMLVSPSTAGTVTPKSGWYNIGSKVTIKATAKTGHTFKSWTGNGTGSYTGTNNPTSIIMNTAITETASFS